MGIWDDEDNGPTVSYFMALLAMLIMGVIFSIASSMDFNDQAGCNIPADKRTEQQNRECGQ